MAHARILVVNFESEMVLASGSWPPPQKLLTHLSDLIPRQSKANIEHRRLRVRPRRYSTTKI
jgi:hypothetical protein